MRVLGDLARAYGDGTVRVTPDQNIVFRWVNACDVRQLYERWRRRASRWPTPTPSRTSSSCPGAESCRLAVTQSRGLGRLLEDHLRARPDLIATADGAQHQDQRLPERLRPAPHRDDRFPGQRAADRRRAVPQYFVMVGGGVSEKGASFGRLAAKVPARRIPEVVERLINLYASDRRPDESATDFFERVDVERVKHVLMPLERITAGDAVPDDYRRSRGGRRVRAGGHGRRMLSVERRELGNWVIG